MHVIARPVSVRLRNRESVVEILSRQAGRALPFEVLYANDVSCGLEQCISSGLAQGSFGVLMRARSNVSSARLRDLESVSAAKAASAACSLHFQNCFVRLNCFHQRIVSRQLGLQSANAPIGLGGFAHIPIWRELQ